LVSPLLLLKSFSLIATGLKKAKGVNTSPNSATCSSFAPSSYSDISQVVKRLRDIFVSVSGSVHRYCTISTKCSWGVTHDTHEHLETKFTGKI